MERSGLHPNTLAWILYLTFRFHNSRRNKSSMLVLLLCIAFIILLRFSGDRKTMIESTRFTLKLCFPIPLYQFFSGLVHHYGFIIINKQMFVDIITHMPQKEKRKLFGHPNDQKVFATPVVERFLRLLSVINIDKVIMSCLPVTLLTCILLLCSGKLPVRRRVKIRVLNRPFYSI